MLPVPRPPQSCLSRLAQDYGVTLLDPTTLNMSLTLTENMVLGAYWDANTSSAVFYVNADASTIRVGGTASRR